MLQPLYTPPVFRNFLVFDLEWKKGEKRGNVYHPFVTLVGVYDGKRYRHYTSVLAFLREELTRDNRGKWFYAHAGGLADMIFILEAFLKDPSYQVEASFSGSSAIIVHVSRGGHKWTFVDSYWLLRDKLANLAKFVDMEKGDIDFEATNMLELIEYNELDCKILWHAIDSFENVLHSLGGQLQMTLASCSMYLFRRKYLKRTIATNENVNKASRQSYIASRVEVFKRSCERATYYDINSSFPHAMTFPLPGNALKTTKNLPEKSDCYVSDVEISVPDAYFPPLPYRSHSRRIYFPVGSWRSWFTGTDIRVLLKSGGKILKVHETIEFEEFSDLSDFAEDLYSRRVASQDEMSKLVLKLLLNSLYGKFGESALKTKLVCFPDTPLNGPNVDMLFPGVFLLEEEIEIAHAHVPIAAAITAKARETLFDYMQQSGEFFYCDTDGFACTNDSLPTGPGLGAIKKELEISEGHFYRPKVYELLHDKGKRVKAKGFTLSPEPELRHQWPAEERKKRAEQYSYDRFAELINGHAIDTRRFLRIRELLRKGEYKPTESIVRKRLQRETPKRRFLENGDSVPWSIEVIDAEKEHDS